ncbi:hypothetical protein JVT61DRAFT_5621 [Boletus reticuloceps]|uniref:Uncharacterized protein n=1 Tax=Boletus reticuloceps TaxID=495285 RepID=A0A8I3ADD7_9AGAM|nr:hypothetical protein JVT61DRAFT_5621 [Boletus reticuloceps]
MRVLIPHRRANWKADLDDLFGCFHTNHVSFSRSRSEYKGEVCGFDPLSAVLISTVIWIATSMPCMPEMQFPGAWPESPTLQASPAPSVMENRGDSLEELPRPSSPRCSGGSATQFAKKHPPLRIVVPPTEYCPFSTDLTLPITPLSLPTPVSSSCFTFSEAQERVNQSESVPPTPAPILPSCPPVTAVVDFASPTSSQFLLMPPTPRLEIVDGETAICVSSLATPGAAEDPMRSGSHGTKSANLRPWDVSSSTWLSDLGGHTETDRIFRHNLLQITSVDTESSPASTPALSPSAVTPSSQASSILAYNSPTSLARSPALSPPALSQYPCTMSTQSSSPGRLVLKPMGTDTFPSALDGLQAWRERVTPGLPRSEESPSPPCEDVHGSRSGEVIPETPMHTSFPSHHLHSRPSPPRVSRASRSRIFIKQAKMLGGRVKRLVTRQRDNKHRGSMDQGVDFRVVTSQDSENGSVILITAPPPPYDVRPVTSPTVQAHMRSRTISEYSSAVQSSSVEFANTDITELGSRQGGSSRNALRRLSFAALSTIKRL